MLDAARYVREIGTLLHGDRNPWKALGMLKAFFDESGIHAGARVTSIAGFVGTADAWTALTVEWKHVLGKLADRGVNCFHMTECAAGDHQFAVIPSAERHVTVAALAGIIAAQDVTAVWAGVKNEAFDRLTANAPKFRARYPKPYDLCFDEIVRQLIGWSGAHANSSRVSVIFAEQTDYAERNRDAYGAWRAHPLVGGRLGALAFDFPKYLLPLQAADLIAYEVAKYQEAFEYDELGWRTNFQRRPTLDLITARHRRGVGAFYGDLGIANAIAAFENLTPV